jgi:hypothetical protein
MGKVVLFEPPEARPPLPLFPTEAEIERSCSFQPIVSWGFSRWSDACTRQKVKVLANVLGLTYLNELCVDCALAEIIKLCERADVNAVLNAHAQGQAATRSKNNGGMAI